MIYWCLSTSFTYISYNLWINFFNSFILSSLKLFNLSSFALFICLNKVCNSMLNLNVSINVHFDFQIFIITENLVNIFIYWVNNFFINEKKLYFCNSKNWITIFFNNKTKTYLNFLIAGSHIKYFLSLFWGH